MQKNRETTIYKPTFREAKHGWFVYKGDVYSVAICDSELFRSAILALRPGWRYVDGYAPMLCSDRELDIMDRWYLLSELGNYNGRGMTLYASHQDARNNSRLVVAIVR